jgi:hypothetical protein
VFKFHDLRVRLKLRAGFQVKEHVSELLLLTLAVTGHEAILLLVILVAIPAIFFPTTVTIASIARIELVMQLL